MAQTAIADRVRRIKINGKGHETPVTEIIWLLPAQAGIQASVSRNHYARAWRRRQLVRGNRAALQRTLQCILNRLRNNKIYS